MKRLIIIFCMLITVLIVQSDVHYVSGSEESIVVVVDVTEAIGSFGNGFMVKVKNAEIDKIESKDGTSLVRYFDKPFSDSWYISGIGTTKYSSEIKIYLKNITGDYSVNILNGEDLNSGFDFTDKTLNNGNYLEIKLLNLTGKNITKVFLEEGNSYLLDITGSKILKVVNDDNEDVYKFEHGKTSGHKRHKFNFKPSKTGVYSVINYNLDDSLTYFNISIYKYMDKNIDKSLSVARFDRKNHTKNKKVAFSSAIDSSHYITAFANGVGSFFVRLHTKTLSDNKECKLGCDYQLKEFDNSFGGTYGKSARYSERLHNYNNIDAYILEFDLYATHPTHPLDYNFTVSVSDFNSKTGYKAKEDIISSNGFIAQEDTLKADPIDTSTGAFIENINLLSYKGKDALNLNIKYNSIANNSNNLSSGWVHNFETILVDNEDFIDIYWDPNNKISFIMDNDGEYVYNNRPLKNVTLEKIEDNYYVFTDENKDKYHFKNNKLVKKISFNEILTLYEYNEKDKIIKVEQPIRNQYFTFNYNDKDKLESVYDHSGRNVFFYYDNEDNLINIKDVNDNRNRIYISYSGINGLLTEIGLKSNLYGNSPHIVNTYDTFGRVISQKDGNNNYTYFEYDDFTYEDKIITKVTDREGNVETLIHDNSYRLIEMINKNGKSKYYGYDKYSNNTYEKDFNGNETEFEYDNFGNIIKEIIDGKIINKFVYDEQNNLIKIIDELGNETTSNYDQKGNLLSIINKLGNTKNYEYDDNNYLIKEIDEKGYINKYVYNEKGHLVNTIDKMDNEQKLTYDDLGRVTSTMDGNGNVSLIEYDNSNRIIKTTDPLGNIEKYTYDEYGYKTTFTDKSGRETRYGYNRNGKLISETYERRTFSYLLNKEDKLIRENTTSGYYSNYDYDNEGRLISFTDAEGNETTYEYDLNGNILKEYLKGKLIIENVYDRYNRIIKQIDGEGNEFNYVYDNLGNLIREYDNIGNEIIRNYDAMGNILTETDAEGNTWTFSYNELGSLVKEIDPRGNKKEYVYDGNGNLISEYDPQDKITSYEYDGNGNLIKVIDNLGNVIKTLEYDELNRLVKEIDGEGRSISYKYDNLDNIVGIFDSNGNKKLDITYDSLSNVDKITDSLGNIIDYDYDKFGRLLKETDALSRYNNYLYNKNNQLYRVLDKLGNYSYNNYNELGLTDYIQDPNNNRTYFYYNNLGKLIEEKNASGNSLKYNYGDQGRITSISNARDQLTTFSYNNNGLITNKVVDGINVTYVYDEIGNLIETLEDGKGEITRVYDQLNRVIEYEDEFGNVIKYEYDQRDYLSKIIYPGNLSVTYDYDLSGNLVKVTDWENNVTEYEYNDNNQLIKETKPDGSITSYNYDLNGQLVELKTVSSNGTLINLDTFIYDAVGNVIQENNDIFEYDNLDRLIKYNDKSYSYDKAGNLLSELDLTGVIDTITYGKDNRISIFNEKIMNVDKDGNLISVPLLDGSIGIAEYDARNRLVKLGNTEYKYNDDNLRTAIIENGIETRFIIDNHSNQLPRLLMETDEEGNPLSYYVYGNGLISKKDVSKDTLIIYHYDRRGSTVALTNIEGNVTDNYDYDIYGELIGSTGTTENIFKYNGKYGVQTDSNDLYYMNARYYNPEIKRFINRDIIVGSIEEPQTFNRYAYVNGNPVSFIDPFGLSRFADNYNFTQSFSEIYNECGILCKPLEFFTIDLISDYDNWLNNNYTFDEFLLRAGYSFTFKKIENGFKFAKNGLSNFFKDERGSLELGRRKKLLDKELEVGTYGKISTRPISSPGDNLTGHHMPSNNKMKKAGVKTSDGVALNMGDIFPGKGGRHKRTFTYGRSGKQIEEYMNMSYRDALAFDIKDVRNVYREDGLYNKKVRSSLKEVIKMNKELYPKLFNK